MPNFFIVYPLKVFLPVRLCEVIPPGELPKMLRYDPTKVWYRPSQEVREWLINTQTDHFICFTECHLDGATIQIATKQEVAVMKLAFNLGEKEDV